MSTTPEERAAAVERIRKLMAVSSGAGATEAEIETYLAKARAMMDKFAIEEHELNKNEENRQAAYESIITMDVYTRSGSIDMWDRMLAHVPKFICDVRWYTSKRMIRNKRGNMAAGEVMIFYGLPRDCEVARALYIELLATMRAMCRFSLGAGRQSGFQDYCEGFVHRLTTRANELKVSSTSSPENGCTAIVILKDQLLKRKGVELGLGPRKVRSTNREVNEAAWNAGTRDGGNVSLGTNQMRGTPAAKPKEMR